MLPVGVVLPSQHNPDYDLSFVERSQKQYGKSFVDVLDKPHDNYFRICSVVEQLLAICQKNEIQIWADYGTLLGLKREGGVILWDYDADFGILDKDRDRLFEAVAREQSEGRFTSLVMDKDYYKDRGCMAAYLQGFQDDIADIIFYEIKDGIVFSLQSAQTLADYPCPLNYSAPVSVVFPLKPEILLGYRCYTWNDWEMPLRAVYGEWRKPLRDKTTWIRPQFHGPCTIPFAVHDNVTTFEQLWALRSAEPQVPFIVRNLTVLDTSVEEYDAAVTRQERQLFGYTSSVEWDVNVRKPKEMWDAFQARNLPFNIVDSYTDFPEKVLPADWYKEALRQMGTDVHLGSLCFVMTNAPCTTHFHTDPRFVDKQKHAGDPGGWMKLLKGRKIWWAVLAEDLNFLKSKGYPYEFFATKVLSELLQIENGYLWGKIRVGEISDGDFLWFPPDTLHKVFTLEHSYGWGGYL